MKETIMNTCIRRTNQSGNLFARIKVRIFRAGIVMAIGFLLAASANVRAQSPIYPFINWIDYQPLTHTTTCSWGYYNPSTSTVTIPIAPAKNFFTPPPPIRGQPTEFLPGLNANAFQVTFDSFLEPAIKWTLTGISVVASDGFNVAYAHSPREDSPSLADYRGQWIDAGQYKLHDVVFHNGRYFVATGKESCPPCTDFPDAWFDVGDLWYLHMSQGTAGPSGPARAPGPPGAAGPAGPAGPQGPVALNWKGVWTSSAEYVPRDAVNYHGTSWVAIRATINTAPVEGDDWSLIAQNGATGPQGLKG